MIEAVVGIKGTEERNAAYQELATKLQGRGGQHFLLHENPERGPPREPVRGIQADVEDVHLHPLGYYLLTAELALGS